MAMAQKAAPMAGGVIVGKAASRALPTLVNLNQSGPVGLLVQAGAGLVAGYALAQVVGRDFGVAVIAGGFAAAGESVIKTANIPILSPALGEVPYQSEAVPSAVPEIGGYAELEEGEVDYLDTGEGEFSGYPEEDEEDALLEVGAY
jgi:hypothetical protein